MDQPPETPPAAGVDARVAFERIYDELHRQAERHFRGERASHTLQPTALVHEAFLRLAQADPGAFNDGVHVKAIAATAMRRILVDHGRKRRAAKRGGAGHRITLDERLLAGSDASVDVVDLDDALEALAALDERRARVVELRFFAGLTVEEAADVLEVSHTTVSDDWRFAKAWLASRLEEATG